MQAGTRILFGSLTRSHLFRTRPLFTRCIAANHVMLTRRRDYSQETPKLAPEDHGKYKLATVPNAIPPDSIKRSHINCQN
ncbi:unnamed protein product, partial [Mesorhabditis belari]|uniref:Uncharacterized protein n=1 Tax=Mesorhabditis belari TaxID=2138241 RepID=A0AAF3FGC2_9BILA